MTVRVENRVPDFNAALDRALPKAVAKAAEVYVSAAQRLMQRTGGRTGAAKGQVWNNPSRPGEPPAVQTGALRRSITQSPVVALKCRVGTAYSIGKYMEFGANPRGKGKKLAVPLTYEASRAEGPRAMALHYGGKSKAGNTLLRDEDQVPQFVLVDSTNIAPRPWARPTIRNKENARTAQAVIQQTLKQEIKLAATKAGAA